MKIRTTINNGTYVLCRANKDLKPGFVSEKDVTVVEVDSIVEAKYDIIRRISLLEREIRGIK